MSRIRTEGTKPMGKSFELMGVVAFQIFLVLAMTSTLLSSSKENDTEKPEELNRVNVTAFIKQMTDMTSGRITEMDDYELTQYLMKHLSESGRYRTMMTYDIEGQPRIEDEKELNRLNYISYVLKGMGQSKTMDSRLEIESVNITNGGKNATVYTTAYEEGLMPVPQMNGETAMVPMSGYSYCQQDVSLSSEKNIQLTATTCTTDVTVADNSL